MWHGDGPITMAQACGEQEYGPLSFVAGMDFDPSDPDEVEIVRAATENDAQQTINALRDENSRLRAQLFRDNVEGVDDGEDDQWS